MRTLIRLVMIAALISYIKGPFKTAHPAAYSQGLQAIQSIPHVLGQMLTNDLALLPKQSPSLYGDMTKKDPPASPGTAPSASEPSNPLSILSGLLKAFEGGSSGSDTAQGQMDILPGLIEWVTGTPTPPGQIGNLKVSGLSQKEEGQLIGHLKTLDLIKVVPKLEGLSTQIKRVAMARGSASAPLSQKEQNKLAAAYQQTIHVLKVNPSFSIQQGKSKAYTPISFKSLLNQPDLKKDKVTIQLNDQSNHDLARFTVSFNPHASSTPVFSGNTASHPF